MPLPIFADIIGNKKDISQGIVKTYRRPPIRPSGRRTESELLALLDSRVRSGITDEEFRRLFARCSMRLECHVQSIQRPYLSTGY